uniref:Putative secreted protein n=1 Tax=Ixodes ricinus TaxID=34613 RepID=A0A6B0U720_IXORI
MWQMVRAVSMVWVPAVYCCLCTCLCHSGRECSKFLICTMSHLGRVKAPMTYHWLRLAESNRSPAGKQWNQQRTTTSSLSML